MSLLQLLAIGAAVSLAATACAPEGGAVIAGPGELGHIHDLVLTADDTLLVASHTGLYRIETPSARCCWAFRSAAHFGRSVLRPG